MRSDVLILGDYAQAFGTLPMLIFTVHYGIIRPLRRKVAPWWRSGAGVMLFLMSSSFLMVQLIVFASLLLGPDFWGREVFRIIGYTLAGFSMWFLLGYYIFANWKARWEESQKEVEKS